jgi:hypothetical protein
MLPAFLQNPFVYLLITANGTGYRYMPRDCRSDTRKDAGGLAHLEG